MQCSPSLYFFLLQTRQCPQYSSNKPSRELNFRKAHVNNGPASIPNRDTENRGCTLVTPGEYLTFNHDLFFLLVCPSTVISNILDIQFSNSVITPTLISTSCWRPSSNTHTKHQINLHFYVFRSLYFQITARQTKYS